MLSTSSSFVRLLLLWVEEEYEEREEPLPEDE
jgi:hypothetical protein